MDRVSELKKKLRKKFLQSGKEVWKNWDNAKIDFNFKIAPKKERKYARVIVDKRANPTSQGRYLTKYPKQVTVEANENLFNLKEEMINKILKHEAIHVGNLKHNRNFDKVAREVGTGITIRQMMGKGYGLQIKEGKRYKDYEKSFPTIQDAINFGRQLNKKTGKRVRVIE